jgi:hypothetical protein
MRAEIPIGTRMRRSVDEGILLYGEENVLTVREIAFTNHC